MWCGDVARSCDVPLHPAPRCQDLISVSFDDGGGLFLLGEESRRTIPVSVADLVEGFVTTLPQDAVDVGLVVPLLDRGDNTIPAIPVPRVTNSLEWWVLLVVLLLLVFVVSPFVREDMRDEDDHHDDEEECPSRNVPDNNSFTHFKHRFW